MPPAKLTVVHLNVRGWTKDNCVLRKEILSSVDADIICITETHLDENNVCELEGYIFIPYNRQSKHINSPHTFGGVGIFVKNYLYKFFSVNIEDKSYDGILEICLRDKLGGISVIIFCCYLPPERSPWGNSIDFFAHIVNQLYLCSDEDIIILCGDINARIGSLKDFTVNLDDIKERNVIDDHVNNHGRVFIEFLNDAKLCVLNGRGDCSLDNFTYVSPQGKSVVDYFFVPHDVFKHCSNFQVHAISDVITNCNLEALLTDKCKKPDHSLISVNIELTSFVKNGTNMTQGNASHYVDTGVKDNIKYNINRMPNDMFTSDVCRQALLNVINKIECNRERQADIDSCYIDLKNIIVQEMKDKIPIYHNKKDRKKHKTNKPYWNEELGNLWKEMHVREKEFLKFKGLNCVKSKLRLKYKHAAQKFDREIRKCKRQYDRGRILEIESVCTKNPREFWSHIRKLGPRKNMSVPMEVYDSTGEINDNLDDVLCKWKDDFEALYNLQSLNENFNDVFLHNCKTHKDTLINGMEDPLRENLETYNQNITFEEIEHVVMSSKNKKAAGFDTIPNEIYKNPCIINVLCHLFQLCFDSGKVPQDWNYAIISPIPKDLSKDRRVPCNYRGISLLCCISKMYSKILNKRMLDYAENSNILCDEQNGFRKNRSCTDHIFALNSIVRNRINEGQPTFTAFIDFKKAFDFVNRDLLLYRLLLCGYKGKLYHSVNAMYLQTFSSVRLNNMYMSDWFQTHTGVKQGDCMSTTLFALYINDLAENIRELGKGVKIKDMNIGILLYADDIVLIAENEADLQAMLTTTHEWCMNWRLQVNVDKSKIMHFRKPNKPMSTFNFQLGSINMEYVHEYRYLGLVLNEHLNYNDTCEVLSRSAGRAFGSCINKFKSLKNMEFKTYTTIYNTCILPVMNYGSEIWGFKDYSTCNNLHMKIMKFFLGVHKHTPNIGVQGEFGWLKPKYVRWKNMCRYWNRLVNMDNSRILYNIFMYDHQLCKKNWSSEIKLIFNELGMSDKFVNLDVCSLEAVDGKIEEVNQTCWVNEVKQYRKLRTYVTFKKQCKEEKYLSLGLTRRERSLLAQCRLGVLPLRLETGRYRGEKEEDRLCVLCDNKEIENEIHFLLKCRMYESERCILFEKVNDRHDGFNNLNDNDKVNVLMTKFIRLTGKFINESYTKRRNALYK